MDIKDSEKLIKSFRKKPWTTIFAVIVFLIVLSAVAWFNGFFGAKGKQAAGSPRDTTQAGQSSEGQPKQPKKSESTSAISQHTEGDQAPIVNVGPGGKSTINYGAPREKGASE